MDEPGEEPEPKPETPSLVVAGKPGDKLDLGKGGGSVDLSFTTNVDWEITVEPSAKSVGWVSVNPSSGKAGKHIVKVSVEPNESYENRVATMTLRAGELAESFTISQSFKEVLSVSVGSVALDASSQEFELTVNSNVEYEVEVSESGRGWIRQAEGTRAAPTDKVFRFSVDRNESLEPRKGSVVFSDGNTTISVEVTQEGDTSAREREKEILRELRESLTINNTDFEYRGSPWDPEIPVEQWAGLTFENGFVTAIEIPQYKSNLGGRIYHLGKIPASIGELKRLKSLILSDDNLAILEPIPPEIGNLESLETLRICGVNIPGPIPPEIGNLRNLRELSLMSGLSTLNRSGQPYNPEPLLNKSVIPESLGNLVNLEKLRLDWLVEGDLPQDLGNLSKLEELEIYVSGGILVSDYDVEDIPFERIGAIPESISGMKGLRRLALKGGFSGDLPAGMGGLVSLEYMTIDSPYLTGSVPSSICGLTNLRTLWLLADRMSGGLPANIGNMRSLEGLLLKGGFGGPIPESLGNCGRLRELSLTDCNFTSFPASLSFILDKKDNCCTNGDVGRFNIGGNRMSGRIPPEIVNHRNFHLFATNFLQRQQDGYGFELDGFLIPACREKYTDLIGGGAVDFDKIYKENPYTLVLRYDDFNMDYVNELVPIVKRLAEKHPRLKVICSYIGNPEASTVRSFAQRTGMSQFPHVKDGMGWGIDNNLFYNDIVSCRQSSPTLGVVDSDGCYALLWCTGWDPYMTANMDRRIIDKLCVDTEHLEAAVDALFKETGGGVVPVGKLILDNERVYLDVGGTMVLHATVIPDNATDKRVKWTSDNIDVVTVDAMGRLEGLKEGSAMITVSALDGSEAKASCLVTVGEPEKNLAGDFDPDFAKALQDRGYIKDSGYITASELNPINELFLDRTPEEQEAGKGLASLRGIKHFSNLQILHCRYNQLTSLDVSANTELVQLICSNNMISSLDLSANTKLIDLFCDDNRLSFLDVKKNNVLRVLYCPYNQLTSLDVSANTELVQLGCFHNQLAYLDLSGKSSLESLSCWNNQLSYLNLSGNTALTGLGCYNNKLTSLNLSDSKALEWLECDSNQISSLNLSENKKLKHLGCAVNLLYGMDLSNNASLGEMRCDGNPGIDGKFTAIVTNLDKISVEMKSWSMEKEDHSGFYLVTYEEKLP